MYILDQIPETSFVIDMVMVWQKFNFINWRNENDNNLLHGLSHMQRSDAEDISMVDQCGKERKIYWCLSWRLKWPMTSNGWLHLIYWCLSWRLKWPMTSNGRLHLKMLSELWEINEKEERKWKLRKGKKNKERKKPHLGWYTKSIHMVYLWGKRGWTPTLKWRDSTRPLYSHHTIS